METRANYVLIGAFTLAALLGFVVFLLWLANAQVSRQFAYYDVSFGNVAGLSTAGAVRYNGLPVGQVIGLELDPDDPSKVRVRIEVDAETPVKTDTVAQLQSQGITGVGYVALSGGSPGADPLPQDSVIQGQPSPIQSVFEGAPQLLTEAIALLEDLRTVVSDDNRSAVTELLANLATASGRLDRTLTDFETLSDDLGQAARQIAGFTDRLGSLSDTAEVTLNAATDTLNAAQGTVEDVTGTLNSARTAFDTADGLMQNELSDFLRSGTDVAKRLDDTVATLEPTLVQTLEAARDLMQTRLPSIATLVEETVVALEAQVATVGGDASALFKRYETVGQDASRLITRYEAVGAEAQARLAQTETAITAFEDATTQARDAIETINASVQANLPQLMQDLSSAAASADRVIGDIGSQVDTISGELLAFSTDGRRALNAATETFANANDTLEAIYAAMDSAQVTLDSADRAFGTMNDVLDTDIDAIVTDVRGAVSTFTTTIERVSGNVDRISEEILAASNSASSLMGTVDGIVQDNRRQMSDFLRVGLPQLQRFVEESSLLVRSMERLVDRIERDPARFFLGTQASEFRR